MTQTWLGFFSSIKFSKIFWYIIPFIKVQQSQTPGAICILLSILLILLFVLCYLHPKHQFCKLHHGSKPECSFWLSLQLLLEQDSMGLLEKRLKTQSVGVWDWGIRNIHSYFHRNGVSEKCTNFKNTSSETYIVKKLFPEEASLSVATWWNWLQEKVQQRDQLNEI